MAVRIEVGLKIVERLEAGMKRVGGKEAGRWCCWRMVERW